MLLRTWPRTTAAFPLKTGQAVPRRLQVVNQRMRPVARTRHHNQFKNGVELRAPATNAAAKKSSAMGSSLAPIALFTVTVGIATRMLPLISQRDGQSDVVRQNVHMINHPTEDETQRPSTSRPSKAACNAQRPFFANSCRMSTWRILIWTQQCSKNFTTASKHALERPNSNLVTIQCHLPHPQMILS